MTVAMNSEARKRLDAHLDAVEQALAGAGNSREQRRGVVDDLEAQILDMLAARSQTPTPEDVEAVLATLDPPAAYGAGQEHSIAAPVPPPLPPLMAKPKPRYSRTAIWGLWCILTSFGLAIAIFTAAVFIHSSAHAPRDVTIAAPPTRSQNLRPLPMENPIAKGTSPATLPLKEKPDEPQIAVAPAQTMPALQAPHSNMVLAPGICVLALIGPLGILGTVLGWLAFFQILGSAGALTGKGLALFDGLFYPAFFAIIIVLELLTRI